MDKSEIEVGDATLIKHYHAGTYGGVAFEAVHHSDDGWQIEFTDDYTLSTPQEVAEMEIIALMSADYIYD